MYALLSLLLLCAQDASREEILQKEIQAALDKLDSDRYTENQTAKEELVAIGRRALPKIVEALRSDASKASAKKRRTLCEILGEIRHNSDEAVQALIERLQDHEEFGTSVAAAAAMALGRVGDDRAIRPLIDALKSKETDIDKQLKYVCLYWLGVLRAKDAVDALLPALEDRKNTDDKWGNNIAASAADALGRIGAKEAVDPLSKQLDHVEVQDPLSRQSVAVHAARALDKIVGGTDSLISLFGEKKGDLYGAETEVATALEQWQDWHHSKETRFRVAQVAAAVQKFKEEQGKYPTTLQDLKVKPADAKTWPEGGYYTGETKDGWKTDLKYQQPGTGAEFDVYSFGKDTVSGGSGVQADIWNHDQWIAVKIEATKKTMADTVEAVKRFQAETGALPKQLSDLVEKYLKELPKDAFGVLLVYQSPGTGGEPFDLISLGLDGREGGEGNDADLWNHDKRPEKKEPGK